MPGKYTRLLSANGPDHLVKVLLHSLIAAMMNWTSEIVF